MREIALFAFEGGAQQSVVARVEIDGVAERTDGAVHERHFPPFAVVHLPRARHGEREYQRGFGLRQSVGAREKTAEKTAFFERVNGGRVDSGERHGIGRREQQGSVGLGGEGNVRAEEKQEGGDDAEVQGTLQVPRTRSRYAQVRGTLRMPQTFTECYFYELFYQRKYL